MISESHRQIIEQDNIEIIISVEVDSSGVTFELKTLNKSLDAGTQGRIVFLSFDEFDTLKNFLWDIDTGRVHYQVDEDEITENN